MGESRGAGLGRTDNGRRTIHVLIRFSDGLHGVRDTVAAHNHVAFANGTVWFGKFGRGMAAHRVAELNGQIALGETTYLHLVQRPQAGYEVHRAQAAEFALDRPSSPKLIPRYYAERNLTDQVGVWIRVRPLKLLDSQAVGALVVESSGSSALDALRTSVAGMFFVRTRSGRGDA